MSGESIPVWFHLMHYYALVRLFSVDDWVGGREGCVIVGC